MLAHIGRRRVPEPDLDRRESRPVAWRATTNHAPTMNSATCRGNSAAAGKACVKRRLVAVELELDGGGVCRMRW